MNLAQPNYTPTGVTRLAPSPTGALHLGNARTFVLNWLLARQNNWRILLRVEDLDGPRVKAGADRQAIDDLRWLGLEWDEGPIYQSTRSDIYAAAIERLIAGGDAYPCICSRREVEVAASAPHADDGAAVYPGTCRGRFRSLEEARHCAGGREPAVRFRVPPGVVHFRDELSGPHAVDVARRLGDFVIAKGGGPGGAAWTPAYQLAVVVDDAEAGVTDVVRGDDLLDSAPRQVLVYRALGLAERVPRYYHLPLVIGPDGRRLAKRHGDTRLSYYRERGVPPGRVQALLARWSGMDSIRPDADARETLNEMRDRFRLDAVPRTPITFTNDDDAWLRAR
jgi:glutamyl-tRNA synthetase